MSLKTLIESQVSTVFLNTDHFAEQVTHRPRGDSGGDETVTVLWDEKDPEKSYERGEETIRRAEVGVPESVACHRGDVWIRDSEVWAAVGDPPAAEGGLRMIRVERHATNSRRRAGGTIL